MTGATPAARARLAALVTAVARDQQVDRDLLVGPARSAGVVRVRFATVWLARTGLAMSWPEIGRELGGRDHTTMIHAVGRADALRAADPAFRALTDRLLADLLEPAR